MNRCRLLRAGGTLCLVLLLAGGAYAQRPESVRPATFSSDSPTPLGVDAIERGFPQTASGRGDRPVAPDRIWTLETVDSEGYVGSSNSLALDAAGRPHIAYSDGFPNHDLKYAYHDGSAWHLELVDGSGGGWASLALDASDRPHISYMKWGDPYLLYAYRDGSTWITETVDAEGSVGNFTSLALDAAGRPHISYWDNTNQDLKYAYHDGQAWQIEIADSVGWVGWYTSLALDALDRPHISYFDLTNRSLKYAYREGKTWFTQTVDSSDGAGWHTSLAVDAEGYPHISYCTNIFTRAICDDFKYAYYDGAAWQIVTLESAGWSGGSTSLVLDAQGYPHISYCRYQVDPIFSRCDALKYTYYDGSVWRTEIVESAEGAGASSSLALDAYGRPHISYYDDYDYDLEYAQECTAVDGAAVDGPTLVPAGQPHLYTATYTPLSATLPVTRTWDNGAIGPTAAYSWTVTGTFPIVVTATNRCSGWLQGNLTVTVFCQAVEAVEVAGPTALLVGQTGTYQAVVRPITASLPVTFTWDSGAVGYTAHYSWTMPGTYTLAVTASNLCGERRGSLTVQAIDAWPYSCYLPLIVGGGGRR